MNRFRVIDALIYVSMTALAFMVLGFFLGMRHATDRDHVIAVTTIVARQKTPFSATVIGAPVRSERRSLCTPGGRGLRIASGVISLAFGLFVAYRTGFAGGLFAATPTWTPQ